MPNGKKKKGHKMATHKRKKRLRKNRDGTVKIQSRSKEMKGVCRQSKKGCDAPFRVFNKSRENVRKDNDKRSDHRCAA